MNLRQIFRKLKRRAFPEIEQKLTAIGQCQWAAHFAVNIEQLPRNRSGEWNGILQNDFGVRRNWVSRYVLCTAFSLRWWTSVSQKLPESSAEHLVAFQRHLMTLRKSLDFERGQIGNADQTVGHL